MDRNLTERLKKLSRELTETQNIIATSASNYTQEDLEALHERVEDIQDEIWDIEDQIRDAADAEYGDNTYKGWH